VKEMLTDTMTSAVVLSIVDFCMSFVFISFIGIILSFFPLINKIGEMKEEK
jgi:hypothetical protein